MHKSCAFLVIFYGLLKAAPLSAWQLLLKYVFSGTCYVFGLWAFSLLSPVPPFEIPYPPRVRNFLTEIIFDAKLKTHLFGLTLPVELRPTDCPASIVHC